jgi:hypothetical protein
MATPTSVGTGTGTGEGHSHRPKGAWYHIRGGYTDTYINFNTKRVLKYCDRYYTEREDEHNSQAITPQMIHYSTVCDLVFSKILGKLQGFPMVHRYDILNTKVRVEMDYLGKTLHDAANSYSKVTRLQLVPRLLEYLVSICYNLKYNGLQHTDLKPGNVLIDGNDQFHLIDFNCMATVVYSVGSDGGLRWCSGIGTWNYVAPEILMTGRPNDTSMVWSIGMVLAHWILGHYPLSNERMKRYVRTLPTSQSHWKRLMTDIRRKYPQYLQLEQSHLVELGEWWPRIQPMLRWNPYKRWTLERVLQSLYPLRIHVRNIGSEIPDPPIPDYTREQTLRFGFQFLKHLKMESLFVQTALVFDRCYGTLCRVEHEPMGAGLLFLCAWAIQGYLTNEFLFDNDTNIFAVHQYFDLTCDVLLANVYRVLEVCNYHAWQKEWFLYLVPLPERIVWERVVDIVVGCRVPYSSEWVARMYEKDLKTTKDECL